MEKIKIVNDRGFTLVEMIVVMIIMACVATIALWGFQKQIKSTSIRTQTSDLYADLLSAQINALTKKRTYFVVFGATTYDIYEDTSPTPNGNGTLETASDQKLGGFPKTTKYNISLLGGDGTTACGTTISFDTQGLASVYQAIVRFNFTSTEVQPEYDCITIDKTRILKGAWDSANTVCATK